MAHETLKSKARPEGFGGAAIAGYTTHYVRPTRLVLGVEFGREELLHAAYAALGLTLVFAAGFSHGIVSSGFFASFLVLLPLAFVAVVPPFFLSLVAQKRVGKGEGCTIEFRLQPQWLAVAVLFAFLAGFVFALTGSTSRFGNVTRTGVGRMSAAATLAYVAFAGAGLLLFAGVGPVAGAPWATSLFLLMASVNSFLAIFSMIPLSGFPGGDVWRWSSTLYVGLLIVIVAMMALSLNPQMIARG